MGVDAGLYALSVLLPPLAVSLKTQREGGPSWSGVTLQCCALTLIGWVPGVIYAMLILQTPASHAHPLTSAPPVTGTGTGTGVWVPGLTPDKAAPAPKEQRVAFDEPSARKASVPLARGAVVMDAGVRVGASARGVGI